MSHIVLLGGRGYYGQHVRWALEQLDQVKRITVASRHPGPDQMQLDVTDPSSFAALKGCDLIVNCTDTVGAPPDALARWCLHEGATLMDMGADTATAERLLALAREPNPRGVVVVGVGIFPGLSTVLARQVAQSGAEPPQTLELGVRLSPLSGAGSGNCRLMAALLAQPGIRIEAGARIEGPAIGGTTRLPYLGAGHQPSLQVGLPDVVLMARATGAPQITTHLALVPNILRWNVRLLAAAVAWSGFLRPALQWSLMASLWMVRAVLLRSVSTAVEMTLVADRGLPSARGLLTRIADGQRGTAFGVAAAVDGWLRRSEPPSPGVYGLAELLTWDEIQASLTHMNAGDALQIADWTDDQA